ncbi:MAG: response regulator [Magnetococcales bacterium]|nr:response regulator [Magnetococcales bacterium]MBF0116710.1 response regulator [Magnetococcales bacterium]
MSRTYPPTTNPAEIESGQRGLAAPVQHALRNQLNAIAGYSEMMLEELAEQEGLDAGQQADLRRIRTASEQLFQFLQESQPDLTSSAVADTILHGIRTFATTIIGYAELLLEEGTHPVLASAARNLQIIRAAGKRLVAVVQPFVQEDRAGPDSCNLSGMVEEIYPLLREAAVTLCSSVERVVAKQPGGSRLLVVDDDPVSRDLVMHELLRQGYQVETANNGRQALQQIQSCSYDLVILDLLMPELNGIAVLEHLHREGVLAYLPVVVISAWAELEDVARCIELGAEDYLPRRFHLSLFRARIRASLEKRALRLQREAWLQEKQQIEQDALRASEEKFRHLVNSALIGIFRLDSFGVAMEANPVVLKMLGFAALGELNQAGLINLIADAQDRLRLKESLAQGPVAHFETRMRRNDRALVDVSISMQWVMDAARSRHLLEGTLEEISDRKHLERKIVRLNEELSARAISLERANYDLVRENSERQRVEAQLRLHKEQAEQIARAKGEFLAAMSHEIRTPMNVVIGMTELLQDTGLNPEQQEFMEHLQVANKNLLNLINQILDLTKIEAGQLVLNEESVLLRRQLTEVADLMRVLANNKGIRMDVRVDEAVPEWIRVDGSRLNQILFNLLGNAIKFTEQGSVTLTAALADGRTDLLDLAVVDTGIGIDEEYLHRIFESFTQADSGITRRYGGTGLGLTISLRLAERMGGTIRVESAKGKGSSFHVQLPLREAQAAAALAGHSTGQAVLTAGQASARVLRVLVAEDSDDNQMLLQAYFKRLPHQFTYVFNGAEALKGCQEAEPRFDAILMDVQMPVMDGYTATRAIRQWERERGLAPMAIVAFTAHAFDEEEERSRQAGCSHFLTKPVSKKAILELIQRIASECG